MRRPAVTYRDFVGNDGFLFPSLFRAMEHRPGSMVLETARRDRANFRSLIFTQPEEIIQAHSLDAVEHCLEKIQTATLNSYYAAGFISYEAGYAFEKTLGSAAIADSPLLWLGLFRDPVILNHRDEEIESGDRKAAELVDDFRSGSDDGSDGLVHQFERSVTEDQYRNSLKKIQTFIVEGDTYQVNYTFKLKFGHDGSQAEIYRVLRQSQSVSYAAYLNCGSHIILSFSPELFFRQSGSTITLKPMKGTAPRGRTLEEDAERKRWLVHSEKDRAENRMIVDLLRNDVGRIAKFGTVRVSRFFEVERFETVHQATSTIQARLRPKSSFAEVVRCLFPSGSVTGAPKIRTMQIIRALEREPRGVYTGAIGYVSPRRTAVFNVAIRTLVLDKETRTGEIGIGSGVTCDSDAESEFKECLLKASFLTDPVSDFKLIETMRWDRDAGWFLLPDHLNRMQRSAKYFGFSFKRTLVQQQLLQLSKLLERDKTAAQSFLVRLTVDRTGSIDLEHRPLELLEATVKVGLSRRRTHSSDRFLFHKTTHRSLYDTGMQQATSAGLFDIIFLNERDEVTEGARSNILIKRKGKYFTPPLTCGVLPGTYRSYLMRLKQFQIEEAILHLDDLLAAAELYVCNAVRGLIRVQLSMEETRVTTETKLVESAALTV